MKKRRIILWSTVMYIVVCFFELLICNSSLIPHWGLNEYNSYEKCMFYLIAILSGAVVFVLLRDKGLKQFLINGVIMWGAFVFLGYLLRLREWIAIFTNNETIVYGVNFLGEDTWLAHYIGCFFGMVTGMIAITFKKLKDKLI